MLKTLILIGLFAQAPAAQSDPPDQAKEKEKIEALRRYYGETAADYAFSRDAAGQQRLRLVEKPVMKWANDDDWSGDVFVWTHHDRPEVIGCILSGPSQNKMRIVFQEFHLLADEPLAPTDMAGQFRWAPKEGLKRVAIAGAPPAAETPAARLTQMRQVLRDFSAHMEADGQWELRQLPQPLMRYQPKEGPVLDGALFTFVWTKGTDPEVILLVECRKTKEGPAWFYAPVRFSNREVWLTHHDTEVWRGPVHQEPEADSPLIYTTRYRATIREPASTTK
jgi:hypothetical protein